MNTIRHALIALAAAAAALGASAQTSREGPYLIAALGRAQYDYDCYWFDCGSANATAGKLVGGYRFGVFAVEAQWVDYGKAATEWDDDYQRTRSLGLNASWTARFSESVEGTLRAGCADVRRWRSRYGQASRTEPGFGLSVGYQVAPQLWFELAWDVTRFYGTDNEGTSFASAVSAGLRVRF
jgi:hypothetical protein